MMNQGKTEGKQSRQNQKSKIKKGEEFMKLNRLLTILLGGVMLCSLAACGETSGSISGNDSGSVAEAGKRNDEIYRIDPSLEKYRAVFYDNAQQKWMKKEFLN